MLGCGEDVIGGEVVVEGELTPEEDPFRKGVIEGECTPDG